VVGDRVSAGERALRTKTTRPSYRKPARPTSGSPGFRPRPMHVRGPTVSRSWNRNSRWEDAHEERYETGGCPGPSRVLFWQSLGGLRDPPAAICEYHSLLGHDCFAVAIPPSAMGGIAQQLIPSQTRGVGLPGSFPPAIILCMQLLGNSPCEDNYPCRKSRRMH
jgi:hypothetical protein